MRGRIGRRIRAAAFGMCVLAAPGGARADATAELNAAFRDAYRSATARTLAELRASVPVFVNRFEQIALYRPGVEAPEVFTMETGRYLRASALSHAAAALAAHLAPLGRGELDEERRAWLARYRATLSAAEAEIAADPAVPEGERGAQVGLLAEVRRFAERIEQRGSVDSALLGEFGAAVRPAVRRNLQAAAASQLDQFRAQVERWKADYPALEWSRAVAVVVGVHQARDRNLQMQFFDRLLGDDPARQERVVFAETLAPPPPLDAVPLDRSPVGEAAALLAKVVLDRELAASLFDDPLALHADVLGPAATGILGAWR